MRHPSFFNEIVDGGQFIEGLVNAFGKVKEHVVGKVLMDEGLIVDDVEVVIDKLLLDCSVVAFDDAVDLGTSGIDEQMGDVGFFQRFIKLSEVF